MQSLSFLQSLQSRAAVLHKRIAFADTEDVRTLEAAQYLSLKGIATPVLIGKADVVASTIAKVGLESTSFEIIDPSSSSPLHTFAASYYQRRKHKGITSEQALNQVQEPLIFAGMLAGSGMVDCCVAGSTSATSDVVRAAIQTVGLSDGIQTVSSYFLMLLHQRILAFADCAVVPYPNSGQLADIAYSTALNFQITTGLEPRVAFLSFSTRGSADHESVLKVREAAAIFIEQHPGIIADGELQVDAALVESVAARKAPDSKLAGDANVLIFPNIDAGNIAYKITERLAGAVALGPIVQGLQLPYCDLSRGCSVEDIINVSCIAALMTTSH